MARTQRWTHQRAVDFLLRSPEYAQLRAGNRRLKAPSDLKPDTAKRYASRLASALANGETVHDAGILRGHREREHHKGRADKKLTAAERDVIEWQKYLAGFARGRFDQPLMARSGAGSEHGAIVPGYVRVTAFESMAVRELRDAAARDQVVYLELHGPKRGEHRELFHKSGYRARLLLDAAGYVQDNNGDWHLPNGAPGLEQWLLDYMVNNSGKYSSHNWGTIRLYHIIVEELDVPVSRQRKRDTWPKKRKPEAFTPETIWRGSRHKEA